MQMTTAISIEDVRREVKILRALSGHKHLIHFYDACEDTNNVYIVMEYVFVELSSIFVCKLICSTIDYLQIQSRYVIASVCLICFLFC